MEHLVLNFLVAWARKDGEGRFIVYSENTYYIDTVFIEFLSRAKKIAEDST